ncbi:hypothetical protein [Oceanomicrobium pacificus]|uniref:SPOR domain-containing protein n=1 Tax=Oceanomicrobium pacificus TaxID=2692916 RepID=A0A6B0TZK0_9RHOB|nr:hypothetical protein [Oceanomicrobium pacificus]MXU66424.1 hypothetical protein [Oceanomicrobium pacificus]
MKTAGSMLLSGTIVALMACTPGPNPGQVAPQDRAGNCVPLFREYDSLKTFDRGAGFGVGGPASFSTRLNIIETEIVAKLCITQDSQVKSVAGRSDLAYAESGNPVSPVRLHIGTVNNWDTANRVKAEFESLGYQVSIQPSGRVGKRIYLGPFRTEGGLQRGAAAAREAGFFYIYPTNRRI